MKVKFKILVISLLILTFLPIMAQADGGVTYSVELDKSEQDINLPSQQAIILWNSSSSEQILSLSTGMKAEEIGDMAWMIPIPSETKPEVEKEDPEVFDQIPYLFAEIERSRRAEGGPFTLGALGILAVVTLVMLFILFRRKRSLKGLILGGLLILLVAVFFGGVILVCLGGARGGAESEVSPIEVIESKQVGIYDVVVVKANDADYMVNWLNDNGYKMSDESIPILQDYCDRSDFYFVVNKINQDALDEKDLKEGIATPLKIKFQPEQPFYPLRLSSINKGKTTIDVYVISDHPVGDESETLSIKKVRSIRKTASAIRRSRNQRAKKAVDSLYYTQWLASENIDYLPGYVATWLHYEGDLEGLQEDAYLESDPAICQKLISEEERGWPEIEITQGECYKKIAKSSDDGSVCEKITDQDLKDDCYKSIGCKNPKWCKKISENWKKESCYEKFARDASSLSHCKKEMPSLYGKDVCFKAFAKRNKAPSLCEEIVTKRGLKKECYNRVASEVKDPSLCEKIQSDQGLKDGCYNKVAKAKEDRDLCDKIVGQSLRESCYYSVAVKTNNVSLCKLITQNIRRDGYSRDCCYYKIALNTNDLSLCEKIENQHKREKCQEKGSFYHGCY